jgi:hypothetical protein
VSDVSEYQRPSDAHLRLVALIAEAQAEQDGAAVQNGGAVLDVRSEQPVIDLRDRPIDGLPAPPRVPDRALTLVLNRVRYRLFGLAAVRSVGKGERGHLELAALASLVTPPDVDDLVRQRYARLSIRQANGSS